MYKLTYSRRCDSYNGKVFWGDLEVWGYYTLDGHAYLNSPKGLLYSDTATGYLSYLDVVRILRGVY